ncbi:uncharacterized protein LOC143063566 isoform X3 [Mytilus galloprovincialis]|uniref:uncharacterized protein LOC143063566 isoform X3 n=1 Tax=Mytilus galloprovincialis TaxID=29158 RepID=UPI003F7B9A04
MHFFDRIKLFFVFIEFVCYSIVCTNAASCDTKIISTYYGDVVLSASSEYASRISSQDHSASRGILNFTEVSQPGGAVYHGAWTAAKNDKLQYIQIQLKRDYNITGVITQGRNGCCPQWVTQYRILYGNDCQNLKVLDSGNGTEFSGNSDQDTMVTNMFKFPVAAKCIHIAPTNFYGQISMRVEILGCPLMTTVSPSTTPSLTTVFPPSTTGSVNVGMTTPALQKSFLPGACSANLMTTKSNLTTTVTSSSIKDKGSVLVSYQPDRAILNSQEETNKTTIRYMGGWSPEKSDTKQYIQVEFSDPTIIKGLVTQGKNGCCNKWVTKYKISYSSDCKTWNVSGGSSGQIFKANTDRDTPVTNILLCPTAVKCLRIQPEEWNNAIGMRFELIGCQIQNGGISASNLSSATTLANQVTVQPTSPSTVSSQATSSSVNSVSVTQQPLSGQHCNSSLFSNMPYRGNITMTSSSELMKADKTNDFSADRGRLHAKETMTIGVTLHGGWSAAVQDTNQFIKVQLPSLSTITGVVTQGKDGPGKEWTKKYRVLYSADCKRYNIIHPVGGGNFVGNTDENTEVTNMFSSPVKALCVQINPLDFHNSISMRMDLIGCYRVTMQQSAASTAATIPKLQLTSAQTPTTTPIKTTMSIVKPTQGQLCHNSLINNATLGSHVNLTASSTFHNPTTGTTPSRAVLDTKTEHLQQYGTMLGGWTPTHDGKQYIQATFSKPQMIDNIITQGVDNMQQWVTKFSIQYSQDCVNWQQLQNPKEFIANTDDKTKVTNKFGCPVFAKCVRVYPSDWHNHSGLRFDLIGCEIIDGPHPNVTLQKTTPGSSTSISTSSKRPNITTASTTLTSTKTTLKTTTASPLTTPNPKFTQSTTIKPTALLPITHKIFPTGQASNYNTRDPLDCKRALLVDPCTNPIVNKHCFYSCNLKQGNNLLSSTNTIPFRQTTTITSKQSTRTPVAVSNVQTTHASSIATPMSAANINVSPSQTSLNNMLSLHSNTMYNSFSTIQSTPTSMLPSSISIGVTSYILHSSRMTQNTIKSSSISPMSTAIASISITPTNAVSSSATHNVLPTGQASIYNSLDPKDCKRSLLMFSCAVPIVAKHCHYSCSKPSSKLLSSSMFHSSVSVVTHGQNSDKTSIISRTSFLNGIQSTQLSQTQINPSKPITNLFTTMNQNSNQINPSSLTSAMFSVTSLTLSMQASSVTSLTSSMQASSVTSLTSSMQASSATSLTSPMQASSVTSLTSPMQVSSVSSLTSSMQASSVTSLTSSMQASSVTSLTSPMQAYSVTSLTSSMQESSVTSLTSSMQASSVTSLTLSMQASSVTSLSSGVTGIFTSSVIKGSSNIQSVSGNFVSSFTSVGITSSNTIGSSSLLGKGNPAISTTYASSVNKQNAIG